MKCLLLLFGFLLFTYGCVGSQQTPADSTSLTPSPEPTPEPQCRTITEQEPYSDQECNMVEYQEAYQDQECQTVPYTDQECENVELSFRSNIDELERQVECDQNHQECQNYVLGICTQWNTVCDQYAEICTLEITNLDTVKGNWAFYAYRNCRANQPLCTREEPLNVNGPGGSPFGIVLDPTETDSLTWGIEYDIQGQEYCSAIFSNIPTKQVCRDVIKTREDCRMVTKYRPATRQECNTVTKYRTVEQEMCSAGAYCDEDSDCESGLCGTNNRCL
ncbi:MAG TPA: hypothetical protein VJH24_02495 [Candidatus Bilamarchaeaceae archaeon]|nr:hypothetical protein [Candidatus Bilamarchaeaceae archaeon]